MESLIRLEPDPDNPRKDKLVGINGQTEIDERVIASVLACKRLFEHIVPHIAVNRIRSEVPDFVYNPAHPAKGQLLELMGVVRDELTAHIN